MEKDIMIEQGTWNKIVMENGGMALHSWEWARAKEMDDNPVIWFFLDDDKARAAMPIYVKKVCGIRFGIVPYGLPFQGDSNYVYAALKSHLRKSWLIGLITISYNLNAAGDLVGRLPAVPFGKRLYTFILDFEGKDDNTVLEGMNKTTRKHIKRGEQLSYCMSQMSRDDFDKFWTAYESLTINKGFNATCQKSFLFNLIDLCRNNENSGLVLLADKISLNNQDKGYLICLKFGSYCLEFLRADIGDDRSKGIEGKMLSWELVKRSRTAGVRYYDFGGVDNKKSDGIYNYKRGFGGRFVESLPYKLLTGL